MFAAHPPSQFDGFGCGPGLPNAGHSGLVQHADFESLSFSGLDRFDSGVGSHPATSTCSWGGDVLSELVSGERVLFDVDAVVLCLSNVDISGLSLNKF
jgi:hypothetical protein